MKTIQVVDITFDKQAVADNRKRVIELRDGALKQNDFEWAIVLSHTVALLYALLEEMEEEDE